jgi:hypothetical protein
MNLDGVVGPKKTIINTEEKGKVVLALNQLNITP